MWAAAVISILRAVGVQALMSVTIAQRYGMKKKMSGPKELKRWTFEIQNFCQDTKQMSGISRCVTRPMTLKDFKKVLKKRLDAEAESGYCYKVTTRGYK